MKFIRSLYCVISDRNPLFQSVSGSGQCAGWPAALIFVFMCDLNTESLTWYQHHLKGAGLVVQVLVL